MLSSDSMVRSETRARYDRNQRKTYRFVAESFVVVSSNNTIKGTRTERGTLPLYHAVNQYLCKHEIY